MHFAVMGLLGLFGIRLALIPLIIRYTERAGWIFITDKVIIRATN